MSSYLVEYEWTKQKIKEKEKIIQSRKKISFKFKDFIDL